MNPIQTPNAPLPKGHYEQAIHHGGQIFVATQLPVDAATGEARTETIAEQAQQVLQNVKAIVEAAGSDLHHIVRMTIYVSDVAHWPEVNRIYESFFGSAKPARGVIPTGKLHLNADVAADCIAVVKESP